MIVKEVNAKPYLKLRIFATLIDYTIYFIFDWALIRFLGKEIKPGNYEATGWTANFIFLFWFAYFPGTEAINGSTPGHDILKLTVIKTDGSRPGFWDTLKRRICDPVDILIYGIPAIICILKTEKHQRIGDLLAETHVIKKTDITEKEISFN